MKNNCLLVLIGLFMVVCLIGGCSGGGNEEIPSPPPVVEKDYVNVATDSIHSTIQGGDFSFTFTTNQSWSASSNQSWCRISSTSGNKGTISIKVQVVENTSFSERTAIITIQAGTSNQKVVVTQPAAKRDKLDVATTTFFVTAEGQDIQLAFSTDTDWEATSDQPWCTLPTIKGEKGSHTFVVTIGTCTEWVDRKATIVLKAGNAQETITITQERAFQLLVTCENGQVDYAGGTVSVKVKCNAPFEVSCTATWIKQVNISSSELEQTLQFQVETNETEINREAEISFYNEEKKLRQSIFIQQEGKPEDTSVRPGGNIGNMTWG